MIVYKIRNADGLFSIGGSYPKFNSVGKIWKRKSDLTQHLNQVLPHARALYNGAVIIEHEMNGADENKTHTVHVGDYMRVVIDRKRRSEEERQEWMREYERQARRQQWEELNKEFGNK